MKKQFQLLKALNAFSSKCKSNHIIKEGGHMKLSPLAQKLVQEHKLSNEQLSKIQGTGFQGLVMKSDILDLVFGRKKVQVEVKKEALKADIPKKIQVANNSFQEINISNQKQKYGSNMLLSKQTVPHYYLTQKLNLDNLQSFLAQINKDKIAVEFEDLILKAIAVSSMSIPDSRSQWNSTQIRVFDNVDIALQIFLQNGTVTPVIYDVNKKSLLQINQDRIKLLDKCLKEKNLSENEQNGGTISVQFLKGLNEFKTAVQPPFASSLTIGQIHNDIYLNEQKQIKSKSSVVLTMNCDHRVIDGAVGAQWLSSFKSLIENPRSLLL